ncbi:MAG TPA: hypothetical protein VIL51_02895, partial [Thermoleophilia bacterium]
ITELLTRLPITLFLSPARGNKYARRERLIVARNHHYHGKVVMPAARTEDRQHRGCSWFSQGFLRASLRYSEVR